MTYISLFSGIEAASVAWHPLGWTPVAFAEIEPFPCAVLQHHFPHVPNLGDVTKHKEWKIESGSVDVLVGGSPCQAFSVAGLRKGLDDPRGNLMLTYLAIVDQLRPRHVVWENVPGVLSIDGGRTFGTFLGALGELGYGFAYRVLDAQYVRVESHPHAVPQRRRRVFVVGCLGDWRRAAAVLFERESLRRHTPPRRTAGKRAAHDVAPSIGASGRGFERAGETRGRDPVVSAPCAGSFNTSIGRGTGGAHEVDFLVSGTVSENGEREVHTARMVAFGEYEDDGTASSLKRRDYKDATDLVAHALRADGFDASEDGTGRGTPLVACDVADSLTVGANQTFGRPGGDCIAFDCKASGQSGFGVSEIASTLRSMNDSNGHSNGGGRQAVAFGENMSTPQCDTELSQTLQAKNPQAVAMQVVRRLTPTECERLQGFPDGWTDVPYQGKPASDGPRYKALGNSMACNVMRWIGERIALVDAMEVPA